MSRGPLATLSKGRRLDRGSMLRISGRRDGVFRTGRMEAEGFGHAGQWNRGVTSALHIPATNHQPPTTNHRPRSSTCKYVQVCTGTEYEASSKYGYYEEVLRTEHAVVCEDGSKLSVLRTSANPCFSSRANHIRWPLITTYTEYSVHTEFAQLHEASMAMGNGPRHQLHRPKSSGNGDSSKHILTPYHCHYRGVRV
jgi:hypothetical protein